MFAQIKAIRKGVKPARWRRANIPLGINFAKLAFILEILLELPVTDQYEFEFFQEKDRLIEWEKAERPRTDYQFTYRDAVKSSVNDWVLQKTWFTFRIKNGEEGLPQYRVEIEKLADSWIVSDKTPFGCPMILRQISYKGDLYWTSLDELNKKMIATCFLCEGEAEYPSFASVCERIIQGRGIIFSQNLESLESETVDSMQKVLGEIADNISRLQAEMDELNNKLGTPSSLNASPAKQPRKTKAITMDSMLNAYSKEDLLEIANECGAILTKTTKGKMAFGLARHLLEPGVMRNRLLGLEEEELDVFESVIPKGNYLPSEEERPMLDKAFELCYLVKFSNETVQVPEDVAAVYKIICSNGYRDYHKKAGWLLDCLRAFCVLYVVGNVGLLYKLYCRTDRLAVDREKFDDILAKILQYRNDCVKIGKKIIHKEVVRDDFYKEIEERRRDVPYYIPSESEILEYSRKGYPASNQAYRKLFDFFRKEFDLEEAECDDICYCAFSKFSKGWMLSDFMEVLNQRDIVFTSEEQVKRFAGIALEVNNNTRMFDLCGHTPNETHALLTDDPMPGGTKPVPTNSKSAGKIYPNDPCPCGSGKKYKKCCGRL